LDQNQPAVAVMACCKCCKPTKKNQTCWAICLFVISILVLIAGFMAGSASTGLADTLKCVHSDINEIIDAANSVPCAAPGTPAYQPDCSAGADATASISQDTLDGIDTAATNLETGMMVPGLLAFLVVFATVISGGLAIKGKMEACCYTCSKIFVGLGILVCLSALGFFFALLAAGMVAGMDDVKAEWDENIGATCVDFINAIQSMLTDAQNAAAICASCGPSCSAIPGSCGSVPSQCSSCPNSLALLDSATVQFNAYQSMCGCITGTLSKVEAFMGPGILGVLGCFISFIMLIGFCCSANCCKKFDEASKINPMA